MKKGPGIELLAYQELPNQSDCGYRVPAGLELPLAGLVTLPNVGLDEKYVTHSRYSTDFSDLTNNLHFKVSNQVNGYVQYVDYSKDYLPPPPKCDYAGSMTRSVDPNDPHKEIQSGYKLRPSNNNQAITALGVQAMGPDVIPFTPGDLCGGVDLCYAASYGNLYLKNNDPNKVYNNSIKAESTSAPPPYYSLKNSAAHQATATAISPSACPSRIRGRVFNANNVGTPSQVSNPSPHSSSALQILPPPNHSSQSNQIIKCNGGQTTSGTQV
ncbi:hypothetical protein EVAR_4606_1 [Eumeta japonica]|uniref:Uncharacterized protein n=1 Tax=Eumeta variegata TaxID=151549 RepID=A0A4C1SZ69_EUMVA|nr:hypothetical protein EVAR_4606_1 [Eumeta japonica]